jgi:hypothetical protein
MVEHGILHPLEVAGIVDMTHEVDVVGLDANRVQVGNRVTHKHVSNIPAGRLIEAMGGCCKKGGRSVTAPLFSVSNAPCPVRFELVKKRLCIALLDFARSERMGRMF